VLLDEPFNGMGPRQRLQMTDLLGKPGAEGPTILFCSNIFQEVQRLSGTHRGDRAQTAGRLR
jgi:ABC-type multidrug transport system ATPase subunit